MKCLRPFGNCSVSQGVLPPKEGDKPPEPPQPNPMQLAQLKKVTADAGLSEARAQHQQAEATQQQLRNAVTAQAVGAPIPDPGGMPQQQQQQQTPPPPQGGFLLLYLPADISRHEKTPSTRGTPLHRRMLPPLWMRHSFRKTTHKRSN